MVYIFSYKYARVQKKEKHMIETSVIILTRNEINGVKSVIKNLPSIPNSECFSVDYESSDGTVEYFEKHDIPVIHQKKKGRSEAFRIGARRAKGRYLVFFSPDGNEDPADIPKLVYTVKNGADLAIASRFMKGSRNEEDDRILKFRKWANQGFTALVNFVWRGHLTDSINGYRAMTKSGFHSLRLDAEGFAVEFQMSIRALKRRFSIVEIPTREGDRIGGQSTSYAVPTALWFCYYFIRELFLG